MMVKSLKKIFVNNTIIGNYLKFKVPKISKTFLST